jgi:phosphate transport system substrate-binding protein
MRLWKDHATRTRGRAGPAGSLAVCAVVFGFLAAPTAAQTVRVGGTGMALATARQLGAMLTRQDPSFQLHVLPSMGTPGGLKALKDGAIDLALAGRRLSAEEQTSGLREALCLLTPLVFASSHPRPPGIERARLPELFADPKPRFADGSPLKIILRSRTGSEMPYLASVVPALREPIESAFKRTEIPVGATDQENADLAHRIVNSFAIMTLLQMRSESLDLRTVALDGVEPSTESLAGNAYPFAMRICLVSGARPTAGATRFIAHARSDASQAMIRRLGGMPSD